MFGQYLKTLMYKKLNNPDFILPYIHKQNSITKKSIGCKSHQRLRARIWHPKEIRHTDMSHLRVKKPEEMSRQEFEEWTQMVELDKNNIDISTDH